MKKPWLALVFAVLVSLAPVARANDGSAPSAFSQIVAQLVVLFVGDEADLGQELQPNGTAGPGDQAEIGNQFPPWG